MNRIARVALAATAFLAVALFAGRDDIRRFRRMYGTHEGHLCQESVRNWPGDSVLPPGLT